MIHIRQFASTCAGALLALACVTGAQAPAQTMAPIPPQRLNWNGDPRAPDISGVWIRSDLPIGAGSREGWLPWPPPLKPAYAKIWKQRVADDAAGKRTDDPMRGCLPPGMPRFITGMTGPMLITQTPGRVILYRDGSAVRRIWLDGRPLPAPRDLENFYLGNAAGRYEGSDLVTRVIGLRDMPIDSTGIPHSDALTITERFHRVDADTLRVEVVLADPIAFTRPMRNVATYKRHADPLWEPRDFLCTPEKDYHPEAYIH